MTPSTEYQRRHASQMEQERRMEGYTGHPRGRIAHALLTAWHYRTKAAACEGKERRFWAELSRSALTRARDDRTKTQPAEARMRRLANALPAATEAAVKAFREAVDA